MTFAFYLRWASCISILSFKNIFWDTILVDLLSKSRCWHCYVLSHHLNYWKILLQTLAYNVIWQMFIMFSGYFVLIFNMRQYPIKMCTVSLQFIIKTANRSLIYVFYTYKQILLCMNAFHHVRDCLFLLCIGVWFSASNSWKERLFRGCLM